jgi:hypothetical protein
MRAGITPGKYLLSATNDKQLIAPLLKGIETTRPTVLYLLK